MRVCCVCTACKCVLHVHTSPSLAAVLPCGHARGCHVTSVHSPCNGCVAEHTAKKTPTHKHTHTHTRTHTHKHTHMFARARAHTYTHAHTGAFCVFCDRQCRQHVGQTELDRALTDLEISQVDSRSILILSSKVRGHGKVRVRLWCFRE